MRKIAVIAVLLMLFGMVQPALAADNALVECGGIVIIVVLSGIATAATGGLALIPIVLFFLSRGC